MASKTAAKIQRDKEMAAMLYNSKEQRVLEKSLQTLRLEQTYALKLLELDHRIIKVRYKKLKENVSKIKSHLPVDDISSFRDLDLQGKLNVGGPSGVNLGSAIKIAAAARRLNLGAGFKRRSRMRSALPTISVQRELESGRDGLLDMRSKSVVSIIEQPVADRIKRSNSITGAFIDAPTVNGDGATKNRPASAFPPHNRRSIFRPQTVNGPSSTNTQKICTPNNMHQNSDKNNDLSGNKIGNNDKNANINSLSPHADSLSPLLSPSDSPGGPTTDSSRDTLKPESGFMPIKESLSLPLATNTDHSTAEYTGQEPMSSFRSTSSILHRPRSPFSSHSTVPRRASAPARQNRRRLSHISTDSIDSNLGENSHEERRQELLEEEGVRAATLDQRTRMFLKDVDDYLIRNPPLQPSHVAFENGLPEPPRKDSLVEPPASQAGLDAQTNSNARSVRFRHRRGEAMPGEDQDVTPTFYPEIEYKERLMGLWKDMDKCRYLRVPDERIDLSGVNTLAKDQMKLFETLRNAEPQPLRQAWET
ncbi:protein ENL-like isoform X3 [Elysia marginata]|uniref:Protein ENL-like isoform X3 n=1 Tax=Elysia marginata TaxID=1093978 RepID=A0AAV4FFR9_9GAST|nr:protein ENL-like isoform X3 [Elysia marginata]